MKSTLYLHLGAHKTGSTSLQNFLTDNDQQLLRRGVLYPRAGRYRSGHHDMARAVGIGGKYPGDPQRLQQMLRELEAEVSAAGNIHTVIVSSEVFEYCPDLSGLAPLAQRFHLRALLYLRRQDSYLESAYNQHLRMYDTRYTGDIYRFALRINLNYRYSYRRLASQWENQFGRDAVLLRPQGMPGVVRDVRHDLLQVAGIDSDNLDFAARDQRRDNISLAAEALPYLARLNQVALTSAQHTVLVAALAAQVPTQPGARMLSVDEAAMLYEKFSSSNRYVFERYLGVTDDLFAGSMPTDTPHILPDAVDTALLRELLREHQLAPSLLASLG